MRWRDLLAPGRPVPGSETGGEVAYPDDDAPYGRAEQQKCDQPDGKPVVGDRRHQGEEKETAERDGEVPAGGPEAGEHLCEIFHAGVSLRVSALALGTFFGALEVIPVSSGIAWALVAIVLYPVTVALFYAVYRRIGHRLGVPLRLGDSGLGLVVVAWLFLCAGDPAVQRLALFTAAAAGFSCGASLGGNLAVIATGRRTGFREALRAMPRLGREAKRRSWLAAVRVVGSGSR